MKWRVILTVCFVLTLFAGFAYLYVNAFVRKHQHAVILFVVPGLDMNLLNLTRQQMARTPQPNDPDNPVLGDARRRAAYRSAKLNIDSFWNVALLGVQEPGRPVPDEGVDATAIACGKRVDNGNVAMDHGQALRSLIYSAEQAQRATGLVTTSAFVEPTPVAFYSSHNGKPDPDRDANDLLYSGINIILGGGESHFLPATSTNEEGRRDKRDLFDEAKERGYSIVRTRDELNRVTTWRTRQLFGVFSRGPFYFSALLPDNSSQPSLAEMTRTAISSLNYSINGYFLVVEDGRVARASEQNLTAVAINEVAAVDDAIQSAVEYAGPDALVVVTNSYNLGAMGPALATTATDLTALPPAPDSGTSIATNAPSSVTNWQIGPGGPALTKPQAQWVGQRYRDGTFSTNAPGLLQPQPALRFQVKAWPTADPAWIASRGEGSAQLSGFVNNTDIFDILSEQF